MVEHRLYTATTRVRFPHRLPFSGVAMTTVKYKGLTATYDEQTAKDLKDAHGIDIEKELLETMKHLYEEEKE